MSTSLKEEEKMPQPNCSSSSLNMNNSGLLKACFNLTSAFLGIGLLTVPYALSSGGWLSLGLIFVIASITFYTTVLVKKCLDDDPYVTNYHQIAEKAFGNKGRVIVSIIMNLELYLVGVGLIIIEADNLHKLFPKFAINVGSLHISETQSFMIITALGILPSMLLTDLGMLSYVSAMGLLTCVIIIISILCVGIFEGVGFKAKGTRLINLSGLPTAVSLYIACFGGHPVVPTIYMSMQNAKHFKKVLLSSFAITTITYLCTGVVGYLMYGDSVESQITLNLPKGKISAKLAIYSTLVIPITKYSLLLTPVANAIENTLPENYRNSKPVQLSIRIALLISSVTLACVFPYFKTLTSIIGSVFIVFASLLLPCLFQVKIFGFQREWSYKNVGVVAIIVFGIVTGIVGTYSAIADIVSDV